MFSQKVDPHGSSTMGGGLVEAPGKSTMNLDVHGPFIAGSDEPADSRPVGTMEARNLGAGATPALAAAVGLTRPSSRTRTRSKPSLDERLARLGISTRHTRTVPGFGCVDIPLTAGRS